MGFHFLGRAGNIAGVYGGDECQEGKTSCLQTDNRTATRLVRDIRYQKSKTIGAEYTLLLISI